MPCAFCWSGLRDSPGALPRAPARTRAPQQSPGLLLPWRVALFESCAKILRTKKHKAKCLVLFVGADYETRPVRFRAHRHARGHRNSPLDCCYPGGLPCSSLAQRYYEQKSTRRNALCFLLERITRLARCASARTGTHAGTATVPWTVATLAGCPVRVLRKDTTNKKAQGEMPCAFCWSGLRDSNSPPPPWQGGALPDELNPQTIVLLYPAGAGLSSPFFADGNKKCRPLVGITIGTTTYR